MDVPALLDQAMRRAGISRRELARGAGTSQSALSSYARGVRSPTVRTLDRLLAACDLQLRTSLEPYLADLDAAVDALLQEPEELPSGAVLFGQTMLAAGAGWAFDGTTALLLQGLSVDPFVTEAVLDDSDTTRRVMHNLCIEPVTVDREMLWAGWLTADLSRVGGQVWTKFGALRLRVVSGLPQPVQVAVGGEVFPALSLLDVEAAHPQLAEVLARLRLRRTVAA